MHLRKYFVDLVDVTDVMLALALPQMRRCGVDNHAATESDKLDRRHQTCAPRGAVRPR